MNQNNDETTLRTQEGFYDLSATVRLIGDDILIAVWGGDNPHIGAVAAAQLHKSIVDPDKKNATVSVFCFPGHMEDQLVKPIAEKIAHFSRTNVVVTAGTHWDHIDKDGIQKVLENSHILLKLIIDKLSKRKLKPLEKEI